MCIHVDLISFALYFNILFQLAASNFQLRKVDSDNCLHIYVRSPGCVVQVSFFFPLLSSRFWESFSSVSLLL